MSFAAINRLWQVGATVAAPVLLTLLILRWWHYPAPSVFAWLCWLHLPLLMIHETEEYVFPGGFVRYLNTRSPLSTFSPREDLPLNEPIVFVVNMGLWLLIIVGAILAENAPYIAMAAVVVQLLNVISHPIMFPFKQSGYNPGLVTALVIILPYMTLMFWYVIANSILGIGGFILAFAIGMGCNVAFAASTRFALMRAKSVPRDQPS
jgi:hypothetical protein